MNLNEKEELLLNNLKHGKSNGIGIKEIMRKAGCFENETEAKQAVYRARSRGYSILCIRGKYFFPAEGSKGRQEIDEYMMSDHKKEIEYK